VALAVVWSLDLSRGQALLVLAPAVVGTGLVGLRQVFLVADRLRPMVVVDVVTNLAQAALIGGLALLGFGAVWLAAATAAGALVNTLICAVLAARLVDATRPTRRDAHH